ncbi:MAG: hypothetical protein AAGE01_10790 [Pseudomonadota bacterium]
MKLFTLALCALLAPLAQAAPFADTDGLLIEYDRRSDGPVNTDWSPLVRVFGDGRLEIAIPWHDRRAGRYEGRLGANELRDLLRAVELSGVAGAEPKTLAKTRQVALAELDTVVVSSETEITRFVFALAGRQKTVQSTWKNLRMDAQLLGKRIDTFERAWTMDQQLHALTKHPSLVRVADMPIAGGYQR